MNVALWIMAISLAGAFAVAGVMKLARPKTKLSEAGMGWTEDFSQGQIRAIGAVETLGALGLVLPAATGVAEFLTPLAAAGLAVTMLLATAVHARRGERANIPVTLVLAALAIVVAVMRFGPYGFGEG